MANKYDEIVRHLGGTINPAIQHAPLSGSELSTIEINLGHILPSDYREFLRDYDGVRFRKAHVLFPVKSNSDGFRTGHIYGFTGMWEGAFNGVEFYHYLIAQGRTEDLSSLEGIRLVREVEEVDAKEGVGWPAELLPLGESPAGDRIALAIGGLQPGAIFYWIVSDDFGQNVYLVADSFDEFMRSLYREEKVYDL